VLEGMSEDDALSVMRSISDVSRQSKMEPPGDENLTYVRVDEIWKYGANEMIAAVAGRPNPPIPTAPPETFRLLSGGCARKLSSD
jgi:hypothetical protein